jgi:murein DD-endopeptidase MepM/ murein hydrolase activator NlpD
MRERISFCLISNTCSSVKQYAASKTTLRVLACLCLAIIAVLAYVLYDYGTLRLTSFNTHQLEGSIASQLEEIKNQRKQIQTFGKEINSLKVRLTALKKAEEKIRIIANLDPKTQDGLFGIGGSLPEDLETNLDLERKHNSLVREMHEQAEHLSAAFTSQSQGFESLLKHLEDQRNLLACTPAIRPTDGWVTSRFGHRSSFHKGLDIATRKGTPIVATANGVVSYVGWKGQLGRVVVIDHGYGVVTRYGHINKALVKKGKTVKRGQKIAIVGSSGRTTGPHVHYEVLLNGLPVNPQKYILN